MKFSIKDIMTIITGALMALADSVPGVSGGTIAYVMGKYDEFVGSIANLGSSATSDERKKALSFLFKLIIGWVPGLLIALSFIASFIVKNPYELISLFLGFVTIAIIYVIKEENALKHIDIKNIIILLLSLIFVVLVTKFSNNLVDLNQTTGIIRYLYVFIVGAIAICAMVLPGISGSTFLLIFGVYVPIVLAVKEVMHFNFTNILLVLSFGMGVLIGLFYFSKLMKFLMKKYRMRVVYFIIGLMIGSLYTIILGPTTLTNPETKESLNLAALNFSNINYITFVLGIIIILALEKFKNFVNKINN